jgi:hypothetical protein
VVVYFWTATNRRSRGALWSIIAPPFIPVLSPTRAFVVEEVRRRFQLNNEAFGRIRAERHVYDEIGDLLRSQEAAMIHNLGDTSSNKEIATRLGRYLEHLAHVYYGDDTFFRHIERERATADSLRFLEAKHRVKRGELLEAAELEARTVSFFRALRQLHILAGQIAPTTYILSESSNEDSPGLLQISIHSERPAELVLDGESYLNGVVPQAYSFRWPTSCSERDFFSALASILDPVGGVKKKKSSLVVRALEEIGEEWLEGLIISSSAGTFGTTLREVSMRWLWKTLNVETIQAAIKRCVDYSPERTASQELLGFGDDGVNDSLTVEGRSRRQGTSEKARGEIEAPIKIAAVRVTTRFAHFQLDILPTEQDDRYVSVISHEDISEQISHLCECTSLFAVFPVKLHQTLLQVTKRFHTNTVPQIVGA